MSFDDPGGPDDAEREAAARSAWISVEHGQIRGLTHAFGDCMHALEMISGSLVAGEPLTRETLAVLNEDSIRGAELVGLLRLVPFADRGEPEACTVGDAVRDAVRLFSHHADAPDARCHVDVAPDVPAVLAPPIALVQTLMAVMSGALRAGASVVPAVVHIRARADAGSAVIDVSWPDAAAAPGSASGSASGSAPGTASETLSAAPGARASSRTTPTEAPTMATLRRDADPLSAPRWLMRRTATTISRTARPDGTHTEIRVPSLAAARKNGG